MLPKKSKPQPRRHTKHDAFAKFSFKDPRILIPFLRAYVPPEIQVDMVFEKLVYESENLVHKILGTRVADILVSVPYQGKKALIFILLEHLRRPLKLLPFRTFSTIFMILDQWHKHQKRLKAALRLPKLPVIFPLVFYNGESPYQGPRRLADLFQDPTLFANVLNSPITLVDTNTVQFQRLEADGRSYVFQQVMKHISTGKLDTILLEMLPEMRRIEEEEDGGEYLTSLFRYALTSATRVNLKNLLDLSNQFEGGSSMKTALQVYVEKQIEGERDALISKGELKAQTNSARAMLQDGLSLELIARYLSLPLAKIQAMTSPEPS